MKKIFFVLPTIGFGGAEKVYIDIALYLDKNTDYDVRLIYLTKISNQREIPAEIKSTCLNVPNVRSSIVKLHALFKREQPDVVFSSIAHLNIIISLVKVLYSHNFKLFLRHTNILSLQKMNIYRKKVTLKALKYFYNKADGVIFQSEYMKYDFNELVSIRKPLLINNPIQPSLLLQNATKECTDRIIRGNKINIIFIGRLVKVKNVKYIINSLRKANLIHKLHLYIIGDGPEKSELIKLTHELSLEKHITFLGQRDNPYQYLKEMDLLVNASKSEGFPNVLLEALGLNIPVFVRNHPGGTKELMERMGLMDYYMNDLDFDEIIGMLGNYPNNLAINVERNFGMEKISQEYLNCIIKS